MTKLIVSAFVVFAAFLASVEKAEAQILRGLECYYYAFKGDDFRRLTCENMRMMEEAGADLRRVRLQGPIYGRTRKGTFEQTDERGRSLSMSNRQRIEQAGGIIAIADGARRILNNPRGAVGWIETAVGAAAILDSRQRGEQRQKDDGTRVVPPPDRRPDHDVVVGRDGIPVAVGRQRVRVSEPPPSEPQEKMVRNAFQSPQVRVYVGSDARPAVEMNAGETKYILVEPGETVWAEAYMKSPKSGQMQWTILQPGEGQFVLPNGSGWEFCNPTQCR